MRCTIKGKAIPEGALTTIVAYSDSCVTSGLTSISGLLCCIASTGYAAAGYTRAVVPIAMKTSDFVDSSWLFMRADRGIGSPNMTVSLLIIPLQSLIVHRGGSCSGS